MWRCCHRRPWVVAVHVRMWLRPWKSWPKQIQTLMCTKTTLLWTLAVACRTSPNKSTSSPRSQRPVDKAVHIGFFGKVGKLLSVICVAFKVFQMALSTLRGAKSPQQPLGTWLATWWVSISKCWYRRNSVSMRPFDQFRCYHGYQRHLARKREYTHTL